VIITVLQLKKTCAMMIETTDWGLTALLGLLGPFEPRDHHEHIERKQARSEGSISVRFVPWHVAKTSKLVK
jgi:hypothetical protein